MVKKPQTNLIVLLVVTIAFAAIVQFYSKKPSKSRETKTQKERPDFYLKDVSTKAMDKNGKIAYTLKADKIAHHPKANQSLVTKPIIHTSGNNQETWNISAENGIIPDHKEQAELTGNVVIIKQKDSIKELTAKSDQTTYHIKDKKVVSEGNSSVITDSALVKGDKIVADIPKDTVEVIANVKAHYEPK